MSLTVASSFADKVKSIATAIVGCITLFGTLMIPVSYYARAEMKTFVENYYEEKYAVGFRQWQKEQRSFRRDFERKLDRYQYKIEEYERRMKERDDKAKENQERQLRLLEELNKKLDKKQ